MSEIHRYKLVVKDFDAELVPCDFGSYVEYREHVAHIKQLEQELAEAKKESLASKQDSLAALNDQARYQWLLENCKITLLTYFFGNGCINKAIKDAENVIDAAIKESSK